MKDNQFNKFGVEDPYYEYIPKVKANKVTYKKVARKIPEGICANDISILQNVKHQAYRYDMWFSFLGVKFGLANVVGLIPILGPIVSNYWSVKLYWQARGIEGGLPWDIQLIFLFNILVDFLLSLIPFVGELIEIGYKANLRNFLLLEKHLGRVGERNRGLISAEEVRPGFINDKVQPYVEEKIVPFVEETIVPNALKASDSIKLLVNRKLHSGTESPTVTALPTIQKTEATATATLDQSNDDAKSIRGLVERDRRSLLGEDVVPL